MDITVSDTSAHGSFITYLYNALVGEAMRLGGGGELMFGEMRTALSLNLPEELLPALLAKVAEIVGVGYKYAFLQENVHAALPRREKRLLCAALIAADEGGDGRMIRARLRPARELCIDGFYGFRLAALREKWLRILEYIPHSFSPEDLLRFCEYLVGESRRKIYLKGDAVFGEDLLRLKRSRLTGQEDVETEIMLSDAGYIYCLGGISAPLSDFLRKYYADRAIFS